MQHIAMHYGEMSKIKHSKAQDDDKDSNDNEHNYNNNVNGTVAKQLETTQLKRKILKILQLLTICRIYKLHIREIVSST